MGERYARSMSNTLNTPVKRWNTVFPLRVAEYSLRSDLVVQKTAWR